MCKDASRRLVIGNIHVIYNPRRGDVKLAQVSLIINLQTLYAY